MNMNAANGESGDRESRESVVNRSRKRSLVYSRFAFFPAVNGYRKSQCQVLKESLEKFLFDQLSCQHESANVPV